MAESYVTKPVVAFVNDAITQDIETVHMDFSLKWGNKSYSHAPKEEILKYWYHNGTFHESDNDEHERHLVALICTVIYYILVLPVVYGNLLVLTAIWKDRRLRNATHALIASLAIADLVVGILTLPTFSLVHYMEIGYHIKEVCMLSYILSHCPTGVSSLTLLIISIERFIVIHYPFKHRRLFTPQVTICIAVLVWIYVWICLPALMFTNNKWVQGITMCNFADVSSSTYRNTLLGHMVGVLLITTILHSSVGYTAWKSRRRIAKQMNVIRVEMKIQRDAKIARMLATVLGIFYICWIPYLFTLPLASLHRGGQDPLWLHVWEQVGGIIVICNSFLNPLVYAWQNKTFRRAFQKILLLKAQRINGRFSFQGRPSVSHNESSVSYESTMYTNVNRLGNTASSQV